MSCTFNLDNLGEFLFKDKSQDTNTNKIQLPVSYGGNLVSEIKINNDIFLFHFDMSLKEDISIESSSSEYLYLNIVLEGESSYKSSIDKIDFNRDKNNTSLLYIKQEKGIRYIKGQQKFKSIGILVKKGFLDKYFFDYLPKEIDLFSKNITVLKDKNTDIKTSFCAKEIFNSPHTDSLNHLYKESKVLEILSYELQSLFLNTKVEKNSIKFSEYDIEALHKAKEIMQTQIKTPPSTMELSRMVKLNDFKLKVGFKKLFSSTPYEILLDSRMLEAKRLLETSEYSIGEIATNIGYKYSQSFTNAFIKRFGLRPKDIMKSRNYYY